MISKYIHLIKSGEFLGFSTHEIACIESWKRDYPDFEIRFWGDSELIPMIQDCPYVLEGFKRGVTVLAVDYCKLKILYEYGGLYMDTDVYSINRIYNRYFEKSFLSWDLSTETQRTNNGTVCYTEPHNPLFLEFIEEYRKYEAPLNYGKNFIINSIPIDSVLLRHGLDISNKMECSLRDQDLEDIVVVNRVQFGVNDHSLRYLTIDGRKPYLMHCLSSSWAESATSSKGVYYILIEDDTDIMEIDRAVDRFIMMEKDEENPKFLILFLNTLKGKEKQFCIRLQQYVPRYFCKEKDWIVYPLGVGLDRKTVNGSILNFITKRAKNTKFCRNLLREV